jgi:PAS domain S-box-containing protein
MKSTPRRPRRRPTQQPRDFQAWFRTTLYSIGDAVITTDINGRVQQMNPVAETLTGWTEAEAQGKQLERVFQIVNEETRKKVENPVERVLREGRVIGLANHTLLLSRTGAEIPIADSGAPIFDDSNRIVGVVLVFRDQSAERAAQQAVNAAREFAESIVETMHESLLVLDDTLEVVAANRSFYRMFRVQPEETLGRKLYDLGNGQWNIPRLRALLEEILPTNSHFDDYEVVHDFEHIGRRTMLLNARRLQRNKGRSGLILLAIEDITERKMAEQAQRESEERFRHISQLVTDYAYAFRVTPEGTMKGEWVTDSFTNVFGYTLEEIVAKGGWQSIVHPDDLPVVLAHAQKVLAGEPDVCEMRFVTREGRTRWLRDVAVPMWNERRDRVIRIYGASEDITDRKETEAALREREERLRTILEAEPECVKVVTAEGILLQMNPAGLRMIEAESFEQVAGRLIFPLIVPEHREPYARLLARAAQGESGSMEFQVIGLKGTRRWLESHAVALHSKHLQGTEVLCITRDITERKRAIDALRENEQRFRTLAESSLTGIYLFQNNVFQYVNPAFARIFGYEVDEVVGTLGPLDLTHPDDRELVRENIRRREQGEVGDIRYDFRAVRKDGSVIHIEVHGSRLEYKGKPAVIGTLIDMTERKRAEEALREQEAQYRTLFEAAPIGIGVADREGNLLIFNKAMLDQGGYSVADIRALGNVAPLYYNPAQRDEALAILQKQGAVHQLPVQFKRKDGTPYDALLTLTPITIHGKPCVQALVEDVTARKRAEEALAKSEAELRALFAAMRDVVLVIDRNGTYRRIAPTSPELLYRPAEELLGKRLHEVFPREQADRFLDAIHEALKTKQTTLIEYELPIRDRHVWFSTSISPMNDEETLWVARDVTQWKRAGEQIVMLAHALRSVEECVSITDMEDHLIFVNEAFLKTYGYAAEELLGKHVSMLRSPESDPAMYRDIRPSTLRSGWRGELINRRKDGTDFPIFLSTSVVKDDNGNPIALIGVASDITERKRAEQALRESEEKFRTVAQTAATAIFIYQGEYLRYVNRYAATLTGYSEEELIGMRFWDLVHPEHREMIRERGLARQRGEHVPPRYEFKILTRNGEERWLDFTAGIIQFQGQPAGVGTAFDITDRKRAEEALRASEERYRKFFERDLTADIIVAVDGTVRMCNPAYVKMFGFTSEEEAMSTNITQIWPSPEKRKEFIQRLTRERTLTYHPLELRRRDGRPVYAIANTYGIFNAAGELEEIQSYIFDDTPKKLLEEQLRQAQKMESLGTLAGGIAHDFNNILGIIVGYSSMLEQGVPDAQRLSQTLDAINKATQRGASLVKQLLTFARKTETVLEPVLVNDSIQEVAKLIRGTFPKTIEIATTLEPNIPPIVADATQIHQVLLNLCVNARDAMPKGGLLSIQSSLLPLERIAHKFQKATAARYAHIGVIDTGIGMDEATRQRIFDPFFTTKGPGKGTGLGLALVYSIVEAHNGFIDVESRVGKGSAFHIYLPIDERYTFAEEARQIMLADIAGGTETILLVEDEEMLRNLAEVVLASKGYSVLTARDGEEGVALYAERRETIHLVICDLGLPKLDGEEVVRRIRGLNSSARVVIASGFIDPTVKAQLHDIGVAQFIQKPYRPDAMLMTVREVLDARKA